MDDKSQTAVRVLNLSYLSDRDWQHWAKASGAAGDWDLIAGASLDKLEQPGAARGAKVVVLHSEPEQAVREAIRAGADPRAALETWQNDAVVLRNALRRHRRTCYLLEAGQILEADQAALCAALADWSGQAVTPPAQTDIPKASRDALGELLALQAVQSMPAIGRLRNELRVGGFALDPQVEDRAQQNVMSNAARTLHQSQERQRQAQESETALRAALNEAQHRLETVTGEYETCAAELGDMRAKYDTCLADLAAAPAEDLIDKQRLAEQEYALLEQRVFALQSALEEEVGAHGDLKNRFVQLADVELPTLRDRFDALQHSAVQSETARLRLKAQLHDCQQQRVALSEERRFLALELDRRQQDISALFESTSWRITAPMRAMRLTLSGRNR